MIYRLFIGALVLMVVSFLVTFVVGLLKMSNDCSNIRFGKTYTITKGFYEGSDIVVYGIDRTEVTGSITKKLGDIIYTKNNVRVYCSHLK